MLHCKDCKEIFPYAVANQQDGTLICFSCKRFTQTVDQLSSEKFDIDSISDIKMKALATHFDGNIKSISDNKDYYEVIDLSHKNYKFNVFNAFEVLNEIDGYIKNNLYKCDNDLLKKYIPLSALAIQTLKDHLTNESFNENIMNILNVHFYELRDYIISIYGYGKLLSSYDGKEIHTIVNGEMLFIFRMR